MEDLLRYAVPGIPLGFIYALAAVGLVLTYRTSGVFNLGYGAQAYVSAAILYQLVVDADWPVWAGALLAVVVVGPGLGLLLERAIFRPLRNAPQVVRLVTALGLIVALPELVRLFIGRDIKYRPPSIAPDPGEVYRFGSVALDQNQVAAIVGAIVVMVGLGLLFRYTQLGLRMRAVVESPRMTQLAGIDADRISSVSWILSGFIAGLAGVLLAPLFAILDPNSFTTLLVASIAAAAMGRLTNIPLTLVGGVVLGVAQQLLAGFLPLNSVLAQGLRPAFPFLMLFLLLLFWPGLQRRRELTDPLAGVDPPPPAPAATLRDPKIERVSRVVNPLLIAGLIALVAFVLSPFWQLNATLGVIYAIIFLSITVLTGMSGMISLAQAAFAGMGAFTTAQLADHLGFSVIGGWLLGGLVAAVIGALLAIPALRLGGLYLTLATLAFGLMVDNVVFPIEAISGGHEGLPVPRPALGPIEFASDLSFFFLTLVVLALVALLVVWVREGTTGKFLSAMRGSEVAASSIGINPARWKVTVFALSAGVAGLGGGMLVTLQRRTDVNDFNVFFGIFWVVIVVVLGVRTIEGAINAGIAFGLFPILLEEVGAPGSLHFVLFGFAAITFARHSEGIVEYQKRKSIERLSRWLNRGDRGDDGGAADDATADHVVAGRPS